MVLYKLQSAVGRGNASQRKQYTGFPEYIFFVEVSIILVSIPMFLLISPELSTEIPSV